MVQLDKVILGDNQFFGINHRSQEKAEEMLKKFGNIDNIFEVYDNAFDCGVKAVMLNSNEKAMAICDRFRANKSKYGDIAWYPSIPYPYKYANMVNELGIFPVSFSKYGKAYTQMIKENNEVVIKACQQIAAVDRDIRKGAVAYV